MEFPLLFVRVLAFATLLLPSKGQSLDLGNDLTRYYDQDANNTLTGTSMLLSGDDSSGFSIAISSDLGTKIGTAYDGCSGGGKDGCYPIIDDLLSASELEIDGQIDRRTFAAMLSKTFKSLVTFRIALLGIFVSILTERLGSDPQPKLPGLYNIPPDVASEASVIGVTTPVTISASGSPVITVTPTAHETTLSGSHTPEVTAVSTAGAGSGSLVGVLDTDLAARLDEIMRRMTSCSDGLDFDDSHPSSKRAAGTLGQAICAAEGAAAMAQEGGTLNDLLLMNSVPFNFNAGDVANAAQVVVDFVRDYSSMLAIDVDTAAQLGTVLFALAIDAIVDGVALGAQNTIPASLIATGTITAGPTTTATTASCAGSSSCVATCDGVGPYFYYCETSCAQVTGCATASQSDYITTTVTNEWDMPTIPLSEYTTTSNAAPTGTPVCSPTASTGKVPPLMAMQLAVSFCTLKGVDFSKDAKLTLGGGDFTPTISLGADLTFTYNFADGTCDSSCSSILNNVIQTCMQTTDGSSWFTGQAMIDTQCGNYTIEAEPAADITTATSAAQPTATLRPETQVTCSDPNVYKSFTVANADVATDTFCKNTIDITNPLQTYNMIMTGDNLIIYYLKFADDQNGCNAPSTRDNNLSPEDCTTYFRSAYNDCDLGTREEKHGSRPLVWNSPNGCIEFWIYGGLVQAPS